MKKVLFLLFVALLSMPSFAQKDATAKSILDHAYATFKNTSGIKAKFNVRSYKGNKLIGGSKGSIQLKGTKFLLNTSANTIWFNGKTQWNYVYKNQEVNVSNPTTAELQNINPYYILGIYQHGFNYKMGTANEVILTAQNTRQSISKITIRISSEDVPQSVSITRRDGSRNDLTISGYQMGKDFDDAVFSFNKKKYPKVEIVDLR